MNGDSNSEKLLDFKLVIHTHKCYNCGQTTMENDCLAEGKHCSYRPIMQDWISEAKGTDLLMLSLRLSCLSEQSKTPIKTFFRFVTLFYERGCMQEVFDSNSDEGRKVTLRENCTDKLFEVFTDDVHSVEQCFWNSFSIAGDLTSENNRLSSDSLFLSDSFSHSVQFMNPSLFIDG